MIRKKIQVTIIILRSHLPVTLPNLINTHCHSCTKAERENATYQFNFADTVKIVNHLDGNFQKNSKKFHLSSN